MSDPITRLNTALEGRYAIELELGEGGMVRRLRAIYDLEPMGPSGPAAAVDARRTPARRRDHGATHRNAISWCSRRIGQ